MATINPFIQPIDYATDVQSPFEAALGGFKLGSDVATIQATQQKRELERQALEKAQEKQTDLENLFKDPNATAEDYARVTAFLPKDQAEGVRKSFEMMTGEQQQTRLAQAGQIFSALKAGQPEIAKNRLKDQAVASRNSGRENDAKAAETYLQLIDLNPTGAQTTIGLMMAQLPGGKEYLENVDKTLSTMRAEAKAPSELIEAKAKADKAVADKEKAVAEAADAPARLQAEQELRVAQAKKAKIEAAFEERKQKDEINKRLADLNLTKAQANKYRVETANLNTTGALLKLDFDAAVKGLPLPSGKGGTVGTATEDERKAAGWLAQADNAYKNMLNAMYTKGGEKTGAQEPGFFEAVGLGKVSQSPERQKFNQASASLAEALLRAATGAGQNEAEVIQKIEELTPTFFDTQDNINQKLAAIPVYLDSLKARAGRAAPAGYVTPTKESVITAKPFSITVGGQAFNFPTQQALDTFTNSDLYKKAAGNK
jgi:hypothetical protein